MGGGLDVPLPYKHFINVLNSSYAIREAILSNNETSTTTCKLAASPVAWLFFNLINNHILYLRQVETLEYNGDDSEEIKEVFNNEHAHSEINSEFYLYAEQAKLIYHSV